MTFHSLSFLLFFPVVLFLYYLLPYKLRWVLLLAASYFFYAMWNATLIFLILGVTLISYLTALAIERSKKKGVKRLFLIVDLVACLGSLFLFKYLNFVLDTAFSLLGKAHEGEFFDLILPVGISFYTFQTLSYGIDVFKGDIAAEKHFGYYALYVSFFPQLVAGPIERPKNLLPQLRQPHPFLKENLSEGFFFLVSGFYKKVVVADTVAQYVNVVYASPELSNGCSALIATLLFAVQIYCDFSGYSEIALGTARMMGIRLMKNFDRPYLSPDIRTFWRKWHISLTSWFTDYLYKPLGGNRKGLPRQLLNIFLVFLVSGLWHGANWTFVIWGGLHGMYLIGYQLLQKPLSAFQKKTKLYSALIGTVTFALVCFAWIFFRSESVSDACLMISRLFSGWQEGCVEQAFRFMELDLRSILTVSLCILSLFPLDRLTKKKSFADDNHTIGVAYSTCLLLFAIAFAWLIALQSGAENTFIYFQF